MKTSPYSLPDVRGEYRYNFDLSRSSWFKVGGNAEVYFKPQDIEDLGYFLKNLDKKIPVTILGNCSNVIIRDGGIKGVVVKLGRGFSGANLNEDRELEVGAGSLNSMVANFAAETNIAGLEFLIGIPGTIGAGIRMNAGAYGTEFKDVLKKFFAIDRNGQIHEFDTKDVDFSYRKCPLSDDLIFFKAILNSQEGSKDIIKKRMNEINEIRSSTQPITEMTSGSTFANPKEKKSWELIDSVGLRGFEIGGAKFSEKHCNFMINTGNAKASDLEELGNFAIKKVFDETGIKLQWEIKRIGTR